MHFMPKVFAAALALGAGLPAAARIADWAKAPTITVRMTNHGFIPARITLRPGAAYVLHFVNRSDRGHDFKAPEFFKLARVAPRDGALVADNKVDLDPGRAATVRIVAPTTPGARYPFKSEHLTDAASGLKGDIYVR